MTAKNDITGDPIQTKTTSDKYRENWEKIFGNKDKHSQSTDKNKSQG